MAVRSASLSSFRKPLYLGNLMIRDSTNNGFYTETLNIYTSMVSHTGGHGNTFTYPLLLKACANLGSMIHGTMIHGHILRLGFQDDLFVQTALVGMYAKCTYVECARHVFDGMAHRSVVSWNSMISAYSRGFFMDAAFSLLKDMWVLGFEPSSPTFVSILSGCSDSDSDSFSFWWQGMSIHCCLIKLGLVYSQVTLANALMGMYVHFSQMEEARKVFDLMDEKSIISWTTIMGGYVKHQSTGIDFIVFLILISGCIQVGDLLLASSVQAFVLKCGCDKEEFIENLLIIMYAKCSDLASARRIFDLIIKKSIFSWTSMIAGYAHSDHPLEALHLFRRLVRTDFRPDGPTVATVISACADIRSISIAQKMEDYISLNGLEFDLQVQTSLIHLYSKCGSIKKAQEVFEKVADKDLTVWSSMINSYAIHGMGKEAIDLFRKMTTTEGIIPYAIVYTSVLLACSHAGLVEDGLKYFISMQKDFGITPKIEHCTCLVDLLGRVGRLDLALDTIQGMPLEAQVQAWAPLLSACRIHGNVELGEIAAVKLLELSPGSSGNYVLMANLHTSFGKWKEAHAMRKLIDGKGLVKECGWSQVEIGGRFHTFAAGNPSRVQLANIYKMLEDLNFTLQEGSYAGQAVTMNNDPLCQFQVILTLLHDLSLSPRTDVISFSPNEETKEALIIVRDFTINNNDASVFLDAQHCCIMKTSLDYLSSLSANDGLSGAMRALISETSTVFAHCSSSYIEANMKIESTASELSRADNLKSDLENNKNQFNDMVASEKELQQKLARLEEMKKELEKQIRTTNANIMASRKELNTTRKRKRGVYVEGKALKAQMDVKEKVPRLQHEHDLAKENQEKIKAEWSEFGEKINKIVVKSAVQD
ncbi:hypothetical protein Ahy_B05g074280 [Arachis hypogaea]|uniref:Pentatricopeptide repeat-containing protein n=1 Tax=Arachis hypogaea TaxID=3818 RepID=A0A444YYF4_ARAHY|nr:hypothetical protein Ahy_B05g074280 [Arachis hypogaea]